MNPTLPPGHGVASTDSCEANPPLAALITKAIGDKWPADLEQLRKLEPLAEDAAFRAEWRQVKRRGKERLAGLIRTRAGVAVDPDSLFSVQAKRIHAMKQARR